MSFELVFLFAVFLLLLLLLFQLLLRAARQRDEPTPERTDTQPLQAPLPPARVLLRSTPVPAGSGTVRRVAPNAATPQGRAVDRRAAKRVILAWPRQRNTRQRPADVALNNHVDLRRAIVVIAILERCRAINPYDSPERSARE